MKCIKVAALMLLIAGFVACKKDKADAGFTTGYYTGWWNRGSSSAHNNMAAIFRDNGTVRILYGYTTDTSSAGFKAEGTYTIDANIMRFRYAEGSSTFIHRADASANMNGLWGTAPSETNGGQWELSKK